jgi:hypothetical protein
LELSVDETTASSMERGGIAATPFGEVGVSHLQVREREGKKNKTGELYIWFA